MDKKLIFAAALIFFVVLFIFNSNQKTPNQDHEISEIKQKIDCPNCNIVMIGITNLRKDTVGTYGYERDTTPNIDNFAKKSLIFENAFSPSSWTLPTSTSFFSSLYPVQHQLISRDRLTRIDVRFTYLHRDVETIIDVLNNNGYLTGSFTGGFDFYKRFGTTERFSHFEYHKNRDAGGFRKNSNLSEYGSFKDSVDRTINWLGKNKDQPFFVYVQGFDAHCPFERPEKNDKFAKYNSNISFDKCYWNFENSEPIIIDGKKYYDLTMPVEEDSLELPSRLLSEEDLLQMKALYDGEISLIDQYVGDLLNYLEKENLLDNTIVIIFSEHGDLFGEHGRFMRGGSLRGTFYDEVMNVPFIFYHPKMNSNGERNHHLFDLVDLSTTLLDITNIDAPSSFEGESFRDVVEKNKSIKDRVYSASKFKPLADNVFFSDSSFVAHARDKDYKLIAEYIFAKGTINYTTKVITDFEKLKENLIEENIELYDLNKDPKATNNVAKLHPIITYKMKKDLHNWIKEKEKFHLIENHPDRG